MSYVERKALSGVLDKAGGAITAAATILQDPALPTVTKLVMELHALEPKNASGQPSAGIGLKGVVTPLRTFVAIKKNPVLGYAAVAAVFALPFVIGYALGKRKR